MKQHPFNQSAPRRAWEDTERFRQSVKSFWIFEVLCGTVFGLIGGYLGGYLTPINTTRIFQSVYPAVGFAAGSIFGLALGFGVIFTWNLFRAPYRQRNEARELNQGYSDQIKEIKQKHTDEISELKKKLVAPILQDNQREHLDRISDLISNWMGSLSIPRISEVWPGTTSGMDNIKNDVRFIYLKEHLPFKELWQNFDDWDSNIQEYLNKCKALRDEIRESWKIADTQATNSFADPIYRMIDAEKLDFTFRITHGTGHSLEEVSHQILTVNGTEVVCGTLFPYGKSSKELGHYRCLDLTLGKEYQKLANDFLNKPLIAELKQLSSSLITKSRNIQESLRRMLEKAEHIKHSCEDCPIREETT